MRQRCFRACVAAAAGGTVAVVCLAPAAATAAVTGHGPHRDTPQCLAYNSGGPVHCVTWAQDSGGSPGLRITATGGYVNAAVIMTQADHSDPMQDFLVTPLGTVTAYFNGGNNDLGLNSYDNVNYGNDELVSVEFAPGGVPSDLCLGNVSNKLLLRHCNGLRWQTLIEATSVQYHCAGSGDALAGPGGQTPLGVVVPGGNVGTEATIPGGTGSLADSGAGGSGPFGYDCDGDSGPSSTATVPISGVFTMLLSCAHVFDNGQHLALTGALTDGARATFTHPRQANTEFWAYVV
jgi:hypothetical protein